MPASMAYTRKLMNGGKEEELLWQSDENMVTTSWSRDGRFFCISRLIQITSRFVGIAS